VAGEANGAGRAQEELWAESRKHSGSNAATWKGIALAAA